MKEDKEVDQPKAKTLLESEIAKLREVALTSTNCNVIAEYIAISDKQVQEKFLHKLEQGYIFKGITCLPGLTVLEQKRVEFHFACKEGTICLIQPTFMVVVDFINKMILKIQDPYLSEGVTQMPTNGHMDLRTFAQTTVPQPMWNATTSQAFGHYWKPEVQIHWDSPNSFTLHAQIMTPNGCYHEAPPRMAETVILPEQTGVILPIIYTPMQFAPQIVRPMDWTITVPTNPSKTSLLLAVEVNGSPVYQTTIGLIRPGSVVMNKELARLS